MTNFGVFKTYTPGIELPTTITSFGISIRATADGLNGIEFLVSYGKPGEGGVRFELRRPFPRTPNPYQEAIAGLREEYPEAAERMNLDQINWAEAFDAQSGESIVRSAWASNPPPMLVPCRFVRPTPTSLDGMNDAFRRMHTLNATEFRGHAPGTLFVSTVVGASWDRNSWSLAYTIEKATGVAAAHPEWYGRSEFNEFNDAEYQRGL